VAQGIQFVPKWNANNLTIGAVAAVANWTGSANTKWSSSGNWNTNSAPNGAGIEASFGAAAATPVAVILDSPETVGTLVFNNTAGYTLAPGTSGSLTLDDNISGSAGGKINVLSGSHSIATPLIFADASTTVTLSAQGKLAVSGPISETGGSASLLLAGNGVLTLSGTNSYSGGTTVTGGTLIVASPTSLRDGSSLTIGEASVFGSPIAVGTVSSNENGGAEHSTTAVPEPDTVALLAATAIAGLSCLRIRKRYGKEAYTCHGLLESI
jgi:autotransporter-associated beta strand protein